MTLILQPCVGMIATCTALKEILPNLSSLHQFWANFVSLKTENRIGPPPLKRPKKPGNLSTFTVLARVKVKCSCSECVLCLCNICWKKFLVIKHYNRPECISCRGVGDRWLVNFQKITVKSLWLMKQSMSDVTTIFPGLRKEILYTQQDLWFCK